MKNLQKDQLFLIGYILGIVLITSVQNIIFLAAIAVLYVLVTWQRFWRITRKVLISIALFNFIVSASYIFLQIMKGKSWVDYIVLLNLRIFDATFLTFFFIQKVNLFRAVAFSRNISFLLTLAYSQINIYLRNYHDFTLAFRSRTLVRPQRRHIYNFIRSTFVFFLNKSIENSREVTLAMKSRCFGND